MLELDAKEAKAQSDLAKAQKDSQDAQDAQNKSLVGNSKQNIKNRNTVESLLDIYSDYISELIDSGASQSDVVKAVADSRKEFLQQAQALGFSASELQSYAKVFDSYAGSTKSSASAAEKAVKDLYSSWQDYIIQLANSGASQKTINDAIKAGRTDVTEYAKSLGLSKDRVNDFKKSFDGMADIFKAIPSNVTVKFSSNSDAATNALKEYKAKLDAAKSSADNLTSSLGKLGGVNATPKINLPSFIVTGKQIGRAHV